MHSRGDLPAAQAEENRDYRILESVYDEEWKPVSLLTVLENGRYLWVVRDVWSVPPRDHTFSGVLEAELLEGLHREEQEFTLAAGERVYVIREGEMTTIPDGIQAVMERLRNTHFSTP